MLKKCLDLRKRRKNHAGKNLQMHWFRGNSGDDSSHHPILGQKRNGKKRGTKIPCECIGCLLVANQCTSLMVEIWSLANTGHIPIHQTELILPHKSGLGKAVVPSIAFCCSDQTEHHIAT
jgi:hypothetical protein